VRELGGGSHGASGGAWTSNGYTAATYGLIDDLVYNYNPNVTTSTGLRAVTANTSSNKLLNVSDISLNDKGFKYIGSAVSTYTYDANGNLTSDLNKQIAEIKYNYLNLPTLIRFAQSGGVVRTIEFVYDATGVKLKKLLKVTSSSGSVYLDDVYDYINGVEYRGNSLQRIAHTEGSVVKNEFGAYEHEYVLRDHLGNTRVSFRNGINKGDAYYDWNLWPYHYIDPNVGNTTGLNDGVITAADIKQINHYYPFGLNMEGNWQGGAKGDNKYQYNGKELNQDFGLDWNDYGARFYDAALARWNAIDPLNEKFNTTSPYTYVLNNPIKLLDLDGRDTTPANSGVDAIGIIKDIPTSSLYIGDVSELPAKLATKVSFVVLDFIGVNDLDNAIAGWDDPDKSTIQKVGETVEATMAVFIPGEKPTSKPNTLKVGPHAKESIPARSTDKTFTKAERDKINEIGTTSGCHTCGSKDPKTTSGNFIPDHQPSSARVPAGTPQQLYPHCLTCSRLQGGQVTALNRSAAAAAANGVGKQRVGD
jgi:RHS repeat-associated protein